MTIWGLMSLMLSKIYVWFCEWFSKSTCYCVLESAQCIVVKSYLNTLIFECFFYIFTQLYLVFLVRPSFKFSLTHGFCFWDVDTSCTLFVILHPSCMCEWCYFLVFIFVYQGAIYLLYQGATLWLHMVGVDNSLTLCDILNADARSCICYLPVTITTATRKMPAELFRSSIWGWCKTASSQED